MEFKRFKNRFFQHLLSAPVIYSMVIPSVIFDLWLEIYHRICFACYNLPYINRGSYIKIDRHKLKYLGFFEKINCAYCGYVNGLLQYASAIAAATEKYWCGIKHKNSSGFIEPAHHKDFIEYGDEESYRKL